MHGFLARTLALVVFAAGVWVIASGTTRTQRAPQDLAKQSEEARAFISLARIIAPEEDFSDSLKTVVFSPEPIAVSDDMKTKVIGSLSARANAEDSPVISKSISAETPRENNAPLSIFLTFDEQYPAYYRKALDSWQNIVIEQSNLIESDARHRFDSENDIIEFLDTFITFNMNAGILTDAEAKVARTELYESFIPAKRAERGRAFLDRTIGLALPDVAYAQFGALFGSLTRRYVTTPPLCYKNTGPPSAGVVLFSPTCNAGIKIVPPAAAIPVPDCGPSVGGVSVLCTAPLGCLNSVCGTHPNAIYNRVTNHCGCG